MATKVLGKVGDIAAEVPGAARVFEKPGIDYGCGEDKALEDAGAAARMPVGDLVQLSEEAEPWVQGATPGSKGWRAEPLSELISTIVNKHHSFVRHEVLRVEQLLIKVCLAHGPHHPELLRLQALFRRLSQELLAHMLKEEQVLFPSIVRMEGAVIRKEPIPPPFFGTVRHPISIMIEEHDSAGEILREIRDATSNYHLEPNACTSFVSLYGALRAFEQDLHQHICLENDVLFPRAVHMEAAAETETTRPL